MYIMETIFFVFRQIWPMIAILSVVLISVRITDLIVNKKKINILQDLINFIFLIYVLMIFHVVTFQDVDWSTYNIVFLQEIFRYEIGSELFYKNIIGNMVMFVPYGFYLAYYFKQTKPYLVFVLATILSTSIEITQFYIGRVFDVDDIFLNVLGALIGFYLYRLIVLMIAKIKGRKNATI